MTIRDLRRLFRAANLLGAIGILALFWTTVVREPVSPGVHRAIRLDFSASGKRPVGKSRPSEAYRTCWERGMPLQEHRDSIKTRSNSAGVLDRYVYHAGFFIMSPGMIRGFAAIFDGSDDGLYAEKERVGDYTLAKVLPDRAVLEKGGETFSLNRSSLPSVLTPHPSRKGVPISPRPSSDEKEEPSRIVERPEPKGKKPTIERHFTVPAEEKQRIIEDAGRIIREAKPEIERGKDGSITGVKIGEVKPGSVAAGMGLQTGDIIRKVNGIPVSSRGQLLKMYDQVVAGKLRVLDVEIERDGRIFTHRYNVPDGAHRPR